MADSKKLTTEEILALARKQGAPGAGSARSAEPDQSAASPPAAGEAPVAPPAPEEKPSSPASPASAPKSTADILAAARAQGGGGGGGQGKSGQPPAAAPKSTADILAAARAQKGPGTGPAASKPAAARKADATVATAAEAASAMAGPRPPLKEMIAAVRQVQEGKAPPKLPSRSAPPKPKLPKKAEPVTRRTFLGVVGSITISSFGVAWAAVAGIGLLWTLGIARFMMPNMVLELPSRFKIGPPSEFPPGTVSEKYKASRGVWIVNTHQYDGREMVYALLSICTHLGCTPNWLEGEQKFKCPCHGSGFYITGINFEGPAPRPLERVGIRLAEDGMLEVDKSITFQEELGQWADATSYVEMI